MLREQALAFGPFRLDAPGRSLTEAGRPVAIGDRALDVLIALTERPGEVLSNADLIARAWGRTFVEEANLRVQVSALRRALRDEGDEPLYVETARGRGYAFIGEIAPSPPGRTPERPGLPPSGLGEPIGRAADVAAISERLQGARLLTLVGPGGIGKTTVALACGRALQGRYADGVVYAVVSVAADPAVTVATSLGLRFTRATPGLLAHLAPLELLLILDGCEYAIDAAARFADEVARAAPGVVILATSREPLRAESEVVWRVEPLATPAEPPGSAAQALAYPAIRLLVDRATASDGAFQLADADVPSVTSICSRLDGLPLAIELAAGRITAFGLAGVEAGLDDRFQLLSEGRRTAPPRHRTLAAAVDWSYDSLIDEERRALRCFSLFQAPFTAADAAQLAFPAEAEAGATIEVLAGLVAKSLVSADTAASPVEYRLLDTTRDYARLKLESAGELHRVAARHAAWTMDAITRGRADIDIRPTPEQLQRLDRRTRDAQSALDWALSPGGDLSVVAPLTLAAAPIWMWLARPDECGRRVEAALAIVGAATREEMALNIVLTQTEMELSDDLDRAAAATRRAIASARRLGDTSAELQGEFCLWHTQISGMAPSMAAASATAIRATGLAAATGSRADAVVARHILCMSELLSGNLAAARIEIDWVLASITAWNADARLAWLYEADVVAWDAVVTLLWLGGRPDSALARARETLAQADAHVLDNTRAAVLTDALCPIALCNGDFAATEQYLPLIDECVRHGAAGGYRIWAQVARAVIAGRRGDASPGLSFLAAGIPACCHHPRSAALFAELAMALADAGAREAARDLADWLFRLVEASGQKWIWSEAQRVRGELCDDAAAAEAMFRAALELAEAQGARAWSLRAATSLARLRPELAGEVLAPLVASFTEGAQTKDMIAARAVLGASVG